MDPLCNKIQGRNPEQLAALLVFNMWVSIVDIMPAQLNQAIAPRLWKQR